jgi:hypothetical protein
MDNVEQKIKVLASGQIATTQGAWRFGQEHEIYI